VSKIKYKWQQQHISLKQEISKAGIEFFSKGIYAYWRNLNQLPDDIVFSPTLFRRILFCS
jgi:hypothetical protein